MVDEVTGSASDLRRLPGDSMKVLASFLWQAEAMAYIEKHKLDNVMVERNMFTGKYDVLDLS